MQVLWTDSPGVTVKIAECAEELRVCCRKLPLQKGRQMRATVLNLPKAASLQYNSVYFGEPPPSPLIIILFFCYFITILSATVMNYNVNSSGVRGLLMRSQHTG